jgi:DNA-binding XRE family transcriptional regulator
MNKNILDTIDMRVLGKELQHARTKRELTQEEAAKVIDVARTTLTAIRKASAASKPTS